MIVTIIDIIAIIVTIIVIIVIIYCLSIEQSPQKTNNVTEEKHKHADRTVAVDLLETGYDIIDAGLYENSSIFLLPVYTCGKLDGFKVRVCTSDSPSGRDEAFLHDFLCKNDRAGNWNTIIYEEKIGFEVEFILSNADWKWKDFEKFIWSQIEQIHPKWNILNNSGMKFVFKF